jgi:hypothetical protein
VPPEVPHKNRPLTNVVGLATVFLIFPLGVAFIAAWVVASLALHLALCLAWLPRGRRVLFVTSDSPKWKPYLDEHVLPRLPKKALVLDWSERARWSPFSLGVWLFQMWSGPRDYNPIAIVVRPLGSPKVFRFFDAFEEQRRGRPEALRSVEGALFAALGARDAVRATTP